MRSFHRPSLLLDSLPRVREQAALRNRTLLRILEREREAFAAERRLLIEQICHLSRSPWTLAPADLYEPPPELDVMPALVVPDHWPDD
jgi:hypothetical protein